MADYILREDGGRIVLEDGSGFLLREIQAAIAAGIPTIDGGSSFALAGRGGSVARLGGQGGSDGAVRGRGGSDGRLSGSGGSGNLDVGGGSL